MRLDQGSNRSSATANIMLYCTWRPSGLTIGLHGQGLTLDSFPRPVPGDNQRFASPCDPLIPASSPTSGFQTKACRRNFGKLGRLNKKSTGGPIAASAAV